MSFLAESQQLRPVAERHLTTAYVLNVCVDTLGGGLGGSGFGGGGGRTGGVSDVGAVIADGRLGAGGGGAADMGGRL
jgi:hypothetical protein